MLPEDQKAMAQQVLDDLLEEGLIPFKLTVGSLLNQGSSQYRVHFYDSRLRSVKFSWDEKESFSEVFRNAVLDRVSRMSGPLAKQAELSSDEG
ncbi:MAG: hypothetical protein ABJB97_09770 [Acidobacteriota bacterium]